MTSLQPTVRTRSGYSFPMPTQHEHRNQTVHVTELGIRVLVAEHAENYDPAAERINAITKRRTR